MNWTPSNWSEVIRRSAGRKRYNALRREKAELRRLEIAEHLRRFGRHRGVQKELAEKYRVSTSTISKDVRQIGRSIKRCPTCGRYSEKVESYLAG